MACVCAHTTAMQKALFPDLGMRVLMRRVPFTLSALHAQRQQSYAVAASDTHTTAVAGATGALCWRSRIAPVAGLGPYAKVCGSTDER